MRGDKIQLLSIVRQKKLSMSAENKIESFLDFLSAETCGSSSELSFSHILVPLAAGALSICLVGPVGKGALWRRVHIRRRNRGG